ncbi:sphingosine-1-phosphate phosphatase 1 [Plakobranchus ocellatus]|uniref:Sphingosine-1-phosphate phosphatase 1 n=1 Tax=Plakobranchus ocellatus TaxID=259542 RepID=A0AAV4B5A6_9GAST|nr:sphingosine-1-phosphate phosphatase 1 [Plakobranchus ocellatus]
MALDIIRVLADPIHVAKFQRICGVVYEKPEKIDQQTQTRTQPSDSDSSDHDEKTQEMSQRHINGTGMRSPYNSCESLVTSNINHRSQCNSEKKLETNNNLDLEKTSTQNISNGSLRCNCIDEGSTPATKTKKIGRKKPYHTIEPTSRIYSKGSIFECDANSTKHANISNGITSAKDKHVTSPHAYTIKYRSLLYLSYFGAFLGNEEFYLTFFPFCIWNVDFLVVRQVAMLWAIVMYLGQATKDYLRWPRPPCPPVVRLETSYIQEFSMPSTHAMAGTAIPMYLAHLAMERYQVPLPVAATVAVLWFSITCFSRLYLGVHSILDLLAGFVYSVLIFFTFLRYVEDYDYYQQTHPFAVPAVLAAALMLCTVCYPDSHKNSSKGDAVQIVAALAGTAMGAWLGYHLGYMHEPEIRGPYSLQAPTLMWLGLSVLRFLSGLAVVAVVYVGIRWASIRAFSRLYGLDRPDKTHPSVMTCYKFTTYSAVGMAISILVPIVHMQLGIQRPSLFYEVL